MLTAVVWPVYAVRNARAAACSGLALKTRCVSLPAGRSAEVERVEGWGYC